MSEEEIIKKANELLVRVTSGYRLAMVDNVDLILQALLDLYNKEKEKNKKYEKLHLTEYKLEPDGNLLSKTIELDDYIHKDKIKEKIKYWKKERYIAGEHLVVKVLQELLEGE